MGAVYAALERLEHKGYVHSAMSDPVAARGGKSRRLPKPRLLRDMCAPALCRLLLELETLRSTVPN